MTGHRGESTGVTAPSPVTGHGGLLFGVNWWHWGVTDKIVLLPAA
jgi:hypothetical protein